MWSMTTRTLAGLGLAALCSAASAQQIETRGAAGGWNVFFNPATQGCFIQRTTAQDIILQIGTEQAVVEMDPENPVGFMSIWLPGPQPAGVNPEELVTVQLGQNVYIGTASTATREGYHGARVLATGSELGFDLRNRRSMVVNSTSGAEITVDLLQSDVNAALDALVDCQTEVAG